ncbi:MAG: UDP-3-O-(3-hydroxymyristoyl)glucosamine N-acyltransferase [Rhodospirillales bacterium]|nr:UDP-3-O-(3-hydroxymyristoyl)glucosamine N-acyltransferase [Rhodospirillales bacterium]
MADPRFFASHGPFSLKQLADISGAEIGGDADPDAEFADVAPLDTASAQDVSFLDNKRYVKAFSESAAGACLVGPEYADRAPKGMALLLSSDPYRAYAAVATAFYPPPPVEAGISPAAAVDESAELGDGCEVQPGAAIGPGAVVGRNCRISANAVVGTGVVVGDDCVIGACASLSHCLVGNRVILHAGVRVGQDGFGFAPGADGHRKVPQLGRVIIGDDVEIGANTTIDRGTGPDTEIGAGTKIDNLVQIAHNVRLGRGCIVVSQVGISGSTRVGDFVMMGGQAGLTGHLNIGDGAKIAAQSGVMRDVEPGSTVAGSPAMPGREYWRQVATVAGLSKKRTGD